MPHPLPKPDWAAIADDIEDGAAVLLIGPDILFLRNTAPSAASDAPSEMLYRDLCLQRIRQNAEVAHSFYDREQFFLFKDSNSKKKAKRIACALARDAQWRPDSELLERIVALQFPVIVSANPDTYLRETFERYGIRHQYDYYSVQENKMERTFEDPTMAHPILYNLCGSTEDANSLVLDYHDLFKFIKNLLSETKFPQKLKYALKNATTFVFLGFQFDRWHAQMMLHFLNMLDGEFDNSSNNYSIVSQLEEPETQRFMAEQFNVRYIGADRADFETLYNTCRQRNLLRKLPNPYSERATAVRMKIAADDLHGALALLAQPEASLTDANVVTLLQGRLSQWQQVRDQNTLSPDDLNRQRSQIRYAILELATQLP